MSMFDPVEPTPTLHFNTQHLDHPGKFRSEVESRDTSPAPHLISSGYQVLLSIYKGRESRRTVRVVSRFDIKRQRYHTFDFSKARGATGGRFRIDFRTTCMQGEAPDGLDNHACISIRKHEPDEGHSHSGQKAGQTCVHYAGWRD